MNASFNSNSANTGGQGTPPIGYSTNLAGLSVSNNTSSSGGSGGPGGVRFPFNLDISSGPASDSELTNDAIARLSELATAALTSPDKETRDSAAQQLLFLSSYEYWDTLRTLLLRAQNNYLRFIIVKAILFLVSNELGPQERTEVQQYVLEYIQERRRSGEELPFYLRNALFSVFASALFSNWKIAIIRAESSEQMNSAEMAESIFDKMRSYLTTDETLDCVLEILTFFARQNSKHSILSVKGSFAKQVLPFFFGAAADMLSTSPAKAATVCSTALECAPELEVPLIRVFHPSDPSITVLRWPAWARALSTAMNQCGQALLEQPDGPYAAVLARLLRQCSTVTSPQEEYVATRDEVAAVLLDVSQRLLFKVKENPERTELLRLSCALLVNTFERNDEATVEFLARSPELIRMWADATRYLLDRPFDVEETDLYRALLHLFYLIAERLLPPKPRLRRNAMEEPLDSFYGASTPPRGASLEQQEPMQQLQQHSPMSAPRGPLPSDRAREVEQQVIEVFSIYMDLVIDTAYQREDSQELRSGSTFVLQTERILQPIAEVLFCERIDLLPRLIEWLHQTINQYELCVRARREQAAEHIHNSSHTNNAAQPLLEELYMTMAMHNMNMSSDLAGVGSNGTPLFFTHVCLSRLSVIVSIFGIALLQGTASRDDSVLSSIANFARQLLGQEDQVTEDLLLCLSFLDDAMEGETTGGCGAFGSTGAMPSGPSSAPNNNGNNTHAQIHIGILRALFFFCSCVYETNLSRNEDFYEITVNLLCYVYRYHSDQVALVADANMLLNRIVDYGSSGTYFLGADKFMSLMELVKEDQLVLLQTQGQCGAAALTSEAIEARHGFLTAFTFYVETRYYAGFPIADVVSTMTERCFREDYMQARPRLAFEDLKAITKGIHQPDTLLVMLEALMRHKDVCTAVVRYEAEAAPDMIAWISMLCSRSRQYLDEQNLSTTPWELTSLVMNLLCLFFSFLSYPTSGISARCQVVGGSRAGGCAAGVVGDVAGCTDPPSTSSSIGGGASSFFNFPTDAVDAAVVYDISDVLHTFCTATWCNLGIVLFYERATVEHFFCGAVELLTTTSVQYLMADDDRARVFNAIAAAVNSSGEAFQQLHFLFMRQGVWNRLVRLATKCLNYTYAPELVEILYSILRGDQQARQRIPQYQGLDGYTLAAAFNEICTLIAVAPHLTYREMTGCFGVLQMSYDGASILCGECADKLLDFCSAYHRVRLRLIINSLRRGDGEHLMTQYMTYFGQSSVVPVLSAW